MRHSILLLTLAVAACQPATTGQLTDQQKAEITAAVTTADAKYWDAWRAADWDRGISYYLDSPDFVWAAGGTVYYGLDALKETKPRFGDVASQTFTFRDSRVIVMSPDVASVIAIGTWAQTDTAGVTGAAREFAWTGVWMLRDGAWKMHLVHMSFPAPAPKPM
jgi:ketosteroid isomerase-like protein